MKGRTGRAAFYLLVTLTSPAAALPREDEAHRLDRLQTKSLNDAALGRLAPAPQPIKAGAGSGPRMLTPAERTLKDAEDHAVEAWRRRAEACRAGEREAC